MITISCPRCGEAIEVDESRRTSRGKIRVKCNECGAKLSMRPRKGDAPAPSTREKPAPPPPETPEPTPPPVAEPPPPAEPVTDPYAVVIENLSDGGDHRGLHEALLELPEFRDHPNRLSDLSHRVPYVIAGLSASQAGAIGQELEQVVALFSAGPEQEVLVGPLRSYRSGEASSEDPPEPDNGAGRASAVGSDEFGFDGDLSEGEFMMPGDPDEEDSVQYHIDGDGDDEAAESRRLETLDDEQGGGSMAGEDSDERRLTSAPVASHDDEIDSSAFGMSMEMEVPVRKGKGSSGEQRSAVESFGGHDGDAPTRMVVSNLSDLDGYRLAPLGLVTHAFCRKAGGEGIEAKKRIHAFGTRYRKALADLAEQAQALGGNTVLGVEVQMQPSGGPDNPVMWVMVQGTAARRTEL